MSDRDDIEKAVEEGWKTAGNVVPYSNEIRMQCMVVKSILVLDKSVEKLDDTSTKLATANNALAAANVKLATRGYWLTAVIVILTVVQLAIAIFKK